MNNDTLAGISGLFHSELSVNKVGEKSGTGDFMALLLDRLAEEPASGISRESVTDSRFYSFTGAGSFNPLLSSKYSRPIDRAPDNQFKTADRAGTYHDKSFDNQATENSATKAADDSRSSDVTSDGATKKADQSEKSADNEAVDNYQKSQKSDQGENNDKDTAVEAVKCGVCEGNSGPSNETDSSELTVETELQAKLAGENVELSKKKSSELSELPEQLKTQNDLQLAAVPEAKIEELLDILTAEEQKLLRDALMGLTPEELGAIAETPDEFNQVLAELIAAMPDSAEKSELQDLVDSPEFMLMLQAMAEQQVSANTEGKMIANNSTSLAADTSESAQTLDKTDKSDEIDSIAALAQGMNQTAAHQETATTDASESADNETSASENDRTKDARRENSRNTSEKNVETSQDKTESANDSAQNEESLRKGFTRLNQSVNEAEQSPESTEATDEPALTNKSSITSASAQPMTSEQTKAVVEEAAKKFFTLFAEKSAGSDKATSAATYSPEAVKRHSATNNNSAGNGSNGFSSHTGTSASSQSAARPATPTPAANHIFSQMLEKAEYLKTQNGSKILNMELDPGDLGKLEMELTSRDGTVTARISAENALSKARLDELAPQIKEQLINQGVNLTEITVDISSRNPDERNRNQMSGGKNRSTRIMSAGNEAAEAIIRKNILPNLRRAALNIKAVDLTV